MDKKKFIIAIVSLFVLAVGAVVAIFLTLDNEPEQNFTVDTSYEVTSQDKSQIEGILNEFIPAAGAMGLNIPEDASEDERARLVEDLRTASDIGANLDYYSTRAETFVEVLPYISQLSPHERSNEEIEELALLTDFTKMRTYTTLVNNMTVASEGDTSTGYPRVNAEVTITSNAIERNIYAPDRDTLSEDYGTVIPYNTVDEFNISYSQTIQVSMIKESDDSDWKVFEVQAMDNPIFLSVMRTKESQAENAFLDAEFFQTYRLDYGKMALDHDH